MDFREIKLAIEDYSGDIARILEKGNDVEIRRTKNGISVTAVKKEKVICNVI